MRQFLPVLAAFMALSAIITNAAPRIIDNNLCGSISGAQATHSIPSLPRPASPARSAEDPQDSFTANNAVFWNYGDMIFNNTNVYMLVLGNMPIVKGLPTDEGQICRLALVGDPVTHLYDPLPEGTYTYVDIETEEPAAGSLVGGDSDFMDVFVNPDDPESGELVAYIWHITGGTVTIEKVSDPAEDGHYPVYNVTCRMEGAMINSETGEVTDSRALSASYTGEIGYDDPNAYTPLGGDIEMDLTDVTGRYSQGGIWELYFHNLPTDSEGYITGSGLRLSVGIITEDPGCLDFDILLGTFTPCDSFVELPPGHFAEGFWDNVFGMYMARGTSLNVYNDDAKVERVGLAVGGDINVSKVTDDIYHFDFNLLTPEGDKMTGTWEGSLNGHIDDFSGVKETSVAGNGAVKGCRGYIEAPQEARVFNASGFETGTSDLAPGIYIVRVADRALKVVVK